MFFRNLGKDLSITIEEDVWIGANVIILKELLFDPVVLLVQVQ